MNKTQHRYCSECKKNRPVKETVNSYWYDNQRYLHFYITCKVCYNDLDQWVEPYHEKV